MENKRSLSNPPESHLNRKWIWGIFLIALAYRGLCFFVIGGHPLFQYPVVDAGYHDHWAQRIVAGDLLGHGPDDVFKPPLYAYFLSLLYSVFGRSIQLIQWAQYLLGAMSCTMAAMLAARLLGRNVGRVVGILGALYAPFVFAESQLLTPALSIFLDMAALLVLVRIDKALSLLRMYAGGVLIGLSAGVRPDVILPAGMVGIYLLWHYHSGPISITVKRAVLLLAGLLTIIAPISVRNGMLTGQFIPVSSNAGINLYSGNTAQADGLSAVPVGLKWERLISRIPQPILEKPADASRWWTARAMDEILANPVRALGLLGKKTLAFFNSREFRNNICFHFFQKLAWPLKFPFLQYSIVLPLALCGMAFLFRRNNPLERAAVLLPFFWMLGFWVVGVVFFVTSRYRLPLVPLLMIPAGWTLVRIFSVIRERQWKTLGSYSAVILAGGILACPMWFGQPRSDWVRDYVNLGNAMRSAGDFNGEAHAYRQALAVREDPDAHYLLARALMLRKKIIPALEHLDSARKMLPDSPDLLLVSAQAQLANQNPKKARELLNQLLELSTQSNLWPKRSEWALTHMLLAELEPANAEKHWEQAWLIHAPTAAEVSFQRKKDMKRVLETFQIEAKDQAWNWYSQANFGLALLTSGRTDEALPLLRRAWELAPEKNGIAIYLVQALIETRNKNEAFKILKKLLITLPDGPLRRRVQALHEQLSLMNS